MDIKVSKLIIYNTKGKTKEEVKSLLNELLDESIKMAEKVTELIGSIKGGFLNSDLGKNLIKYLDGPLTSKYLEILEDIKRFPDIFPEFDKGDSGEFKFFPLKKSTLPKLSGTIEGDRRPGIIDVYENINKNLCIQA